MPKDFYIAVGGVLIMAAILWWLDERFARKLKEAMRGNRKDRNTTTEE